MSTFPLFPSLPAELQLLIWESALPSPAIHLLDIHVPPLQENADTELESEGKAYLDIFHPAPGELDPSAYKARDSLRMACRAASKVALASTPKPNQTEDAGDNEDENKIPLPLGGRILCYDHANDVLFLHFRQSEAPITGEDQSSLAPPSNLNYGSETPSTHPIACALVTPWSDSMASSIRSARKIALDVDELAGMPVDEVPFLACVLQNRLECLYLVAEEGKVSASFEKEHLREQVALGPKNGVRDVLYGIGRKYTQVWESEWEERLGWGKEHGMRELVDVLEEQISSQQRDCGCEVFRAVRVLGEETW